jgi:hypothetical protein
MNGLIMIENDKNFIPVYKTDKNIKVVKSINTKKYNIT